MGQVVENEMFRNGSRLTFVIQCQIKLTNIYDCVSGCGVSVKQGAQRRIVGGDEAGFGSFPWQVGILSQARLLHRISAISRDV